MTLGDFKRNIINLGFEEGDVFDENESLFTDSVRRAQLMIYAAVEYGDGSELPKEALSDSDELDIKEELIPLLQLLCAYFVWLDDDERKAVMYYNLYTEQLSLYMQRNKSAVITEGIDI